MTLTVWLCAAAAQATTDCTFFVRAGFVPANGPPNGRSPESAFPTIKDGAKAIANRGDVLCVGPGRYVEGNIGIRDGAGIDGTMGNPIEIRGDETGQSTGDAPGSVQIVPPDDKIITTAFLIFGHHDILIDGFAISGFSDAGIQVRAEPVSGTSSTGITIRNNTISGCKTGIDVIARDGITIADNTTVGNDHSGIAIEACLFQEGEGRCRDLSGAPVKPVVSNNRSGGNGAHGISIRAADDAVIKHNVVYANGDKGIVLEECNDPLVANNLVYANAQQGVAIGKTDASPDALVVNNTLYANGTWGLEIGTKTGGSPGASVVNNVIWQNRGGDAGIGGVGVLNEDSGVNAVRPASICRYLAGFNVIEADAYGPDTPHNQYDIHADPLLLDPAGPDGILGGQQPGYGFVDHSADDDFHLPQSDPVSPAVDAGSGSVTELTLDGSTASDGQPDHGIVDVGFHYAATTEKTITLAPPFMPLYVRVGGSDAGDGFTPGGAFAHIATAAARAQAGITVVVGPGRYPECNLRPRAHGGLTAFVADPSGQQTADAPGAVLIDAGQCLVDQGSGAVQPGEVGFDISSECGVIVDGFHVTGAKEDGIRIDDHSDGAALRNNVVFCAGACEMRGIHAINSDDVRIANNLVYGTRAGIHLGGITRSDDSSTPGCRRALIEFNTAMNSAFNGIQVGDGIGVSSLATVRYNVTAGNRQHGVEVGDDSTREANLRGFTNEYNFIGDNYATDVEKGDGDLVLDPTVWPLYLDPSAVDVSGDWLLDGHFRLAQTAAGQTTQSRAVDAVDTVTAVDAGMDGRSTRSDGGPDTGNVDLGYHYPRHGTLAGDCNGDGVVRINELVLAVNIATEAAPMTDCPAVDTDADGRAEINELIGAVNNGLRG